MIATSAGTAIVTMIAPVLIFPTLLCSSESTSSKSLFRTCPRERVHEVRLSRGAETTVVFTVDEAVFRGPRHRLLTKYFDQTAAVAYLPSTGVTELKKPGGMTVLGPSVAFPISVFGGQLLKTGLRAPK